MDKQTTAQVAKALNMTRRKIHTILRSYPQLRPREQTGKVAHYLWSAAEIAALQAHIAAHPHIRVSRQTRIQLTPQGRDDGE
jgi:hypothetical protein